MSLQVPHLLKYKSVEIIKRLLLEDDKITFKISETTKRKEKPSVKPVKQQKRTRNLQTHVREWSIT